MSFIGRLAEGLGAAFRGTGRASEAIPEAELRRLAETSPHLLEDLGFRQDRASGGWSFGARRVTAPGPSGGEAWRAGRG